MKTRAKVIIGAAAAVCAIGGLAIATPQVGIILNLPVVTGAIIKDVHDHVHVNLTPTSGENEDNEWNGEFSTEGASNFAFADLNVVANGGRYAPPHVVERVGTSLNPLLLKQQRQVISAATAQQMTTMMEAVVQHGSGFTARVKGFELNEAGKTGTAQIPVSGQYTLDVWASYVGFLPANHPKFTMLVVVRKPHAPGSNNDWTLNDGYITAGPIWQKIAQSMVVDWRITPN